VTTSPAESEKSGIGLAQLGDRAQAALIAATAGKPPLVINPAGADNGPLSVEVLDSLERLFLVTLRPVAFLAPGDRVDAIRVKLRISDEQKDVWRIVSWTQASNGREVIDIGKLTDTASEKFTASTGIGLGLALPDAAIGYEANRSKAREIDIKDVTELSAAVDESGNAWLDESAGWRLNLAHNLSMGVVVTTNKLVQTTVVATSDLMQKPKTDTGIAVPSPASAVKLTRTLRFIPALDQEPICGVAELDYRIRHIVGEKGSATFSESDDTIEFWTGSASAHFMVAPAPYRTVFTLLSNGRALAYALEPNGQPDLLSFSSVAEAVEFRTWLLFSTPKSGKLGNASIGYAGPTGIVALTPTQISAVVVATIDDKKLALTRQSSSCSSPMASAMPTEPPKAEAP
jgi:hypothetical protein